jgi:hypothetical protein
MCVEPSNFFLVDLGFFCQFKRIDTSHRGIGGPLIGAPLIGVPLIGAPLILYKYRVHFHL